MKLTRHSIIINLEGANTLGDLCIPDNAKGLVIFSHGSGSSRKSPRNQFVAEILNKNGYATLLFDLLTPEEDEVYENRFNIELLSGRLTHVAIWALNDDGLKHLPIGFFGASTGAASALFACAVLQNKIKAVVSRGGRPDLALPVLEKINTPVLLIVGAFDDEVIELNKSAYNKLGGVKEIKLIEGATHLFEEPGTLEKAAESAVHWFKLHLK